MEKEESLWFLTTCVSKARNLFGVPRIILSNNKVLNESDLYLLFSDSDFFHQIDEKYFNFIEDWMVFESNDYIEANSIKIIFDLCRRDFTQNDELFENIPKDFRKLFNLKLRSDDREKFQKYNKKYFDLNEYVFDSVVKSKFNEIWNERWSRESSYGINSV